MNILVNQETVNDTAKLMMHRLISREIGRDSSLVERAKLSHALTARRYAGRSFVREWDDLLRLPPNKLRARLISRESEMVRLRASSPFLLTAGIDFTDYGFRLRIRRAARRVVERSLTCNRHGLYYRQPSDPDGLARRAGDYTRYARSRCVSGERQDLGN